MAEPLGMDYKALHVITDPATGARAYNPGDLVHESAVVGDRAWLALGVDVEPREGVSVSRPPKNAPQAAWVEFAVAEGCDRDQAEGLTRKQLIDAYGEDATAETRGGIESEPDPADVTTAEDSDGAD